MADDDLDDRLSRRFESAPNDENEAASETTDPSMSSTPSQKDQKNQKNKKAQKEQKAKNIKKEWNVRSFYLSDDLDSRLSTAFKRLDLELSEANSEVNLKKTRHFYPLLVELGLDQLEQMDITEVTERLESKDSV